MTKREIARRMAQQIRVSRGEAADRLDRAVHAILSDLRQRKSPALPGLGKFVQDADGRLRFERDEGVRQ